MPRVDRNAVTRNLDDSFKMATDDEGNQIPTTPAEALLAAQTYLQCARPDDQNPLAEAHHNTVRALKLVGEALAPSAPRKRTASRRSHDSPVRDHLSPRRYYISQDDDSDNDYRDTRSRRGPDRSQEHDDRRCDARGDIAQNKVNRARRLRAARGDTSEDSQSDQDAGPCGALCFTRDVREAPMPQGFKLTTATPKYDGLEEPEGWLEDYLTAVKFQGGSHVTAMQYVQLMLTGAAHH